MVGTLLYSGEHPGTLFLATLFNYLYRVLALAFLSLSHGPSALVTLLTRPPGTADPHMPLKEGNQAGPPAPPWAYFLIIVFLGYMGFILAHSVNTSELDVNFQQSMEEFGAAAWLALIWFAQDVTGRRLVMDPKETLTHNLGYNAGDTGILGLAVLTGAFLLVAGEMFGMARTPWWIVGALLFYRWLQAVGEEEKKVKQ